MERSVIILLFFSCLIGDALTDDLPDGPRVHVDQLGGLRGVYLNSSSGQRISAFLGIPYAQPPLKQLRFSDPVAINPWDGERDATQSAPCCMQTATGSGHRRQLPESEDCLYLNVYTKSTDPAMTKKPVMVFIHGGMWTAGCGDMTFHGPAYLLNENIVLVTINYRLGIFGFITTGDRTAPGNYGLLDQNLALKWVQQYIRSLGGDPGSVTIFGESAGGYAVSHHVLSPLSSGLFHKAVCQSGTSLCPRAMVEGNSKQMKRQAQSMGYSGSMTDSDGLMEFFRNQPAQSLVDVQFNLTTFKGTPAIYGPRVDRERPEPFLPDDPRNMLRSGNYNRVPTISGVNKDEGAGIFGSLLAANQSDLRTLKNNYRKLLPGLLEFHLTVADPAGVAETIWNHYGASRDLPSPLVEMIGDRLYYAGFIEDVDLKMQNPSQMYLYHLTEKPTSDPDSKTAHLGVAHGDDLDYLFPSERRRHLYSHGSHDYNMSHLMVTLFTSFAETGVPRASQIESDVTFTWLPTLVGHRRFLDLNLQLRMVDGPLPFERRLPFWTTLPLDE